MNLDQLHALNVATETPARKMLTALQLKAIDDARVVTTGGRAVRKHGQVLTETGHVYAGTVPADEVARRRARNKVARASRRANRK